jgi:hypothetical protein
VKQTNLTKQGVKNLDMLFPRKSVGRKLELPPGQLAGCKHSRMRVDADGDSICPDCGHMSEEKWHHA